VVLFTLLVQGITTPLLLKKLNLIGDYPQRQEYAALISRQLALKEILTKLQHPENLPKIDPKRFRERQMLVENQLNNVTDRLEKLLESYPQLETIANEKFDQAILDIEVETYAELIRVGRLDEDLTPLMGSLEEEHTTH
jgi:CPA1 family monovalent cation:H+ antiporter